MINTNTTQSFTFNPGKPRNSMEQSAASEFGSVKREAESIADYFKASDNKPNDLEPKLDKVILYNSKMDEARKISGKAQFSEGKLSSMNAQEEMFRSHLNNNTVYDVKVDSKNNSVQYNVGNFSLGDNYFTNFTQRADGMVDYKGNAGWGVA